MITSCHCTEGERQMTATTVDPTCVWESRATLAASLAVSRVSAASRCAAASCVCSSLTLCVSHQKQVKHTGNLRMAPQKRASPHATAQGCS